MRKVFEAYLKYRYEQAGALTPGQQLEVVRRLRDEALQGKVPISESTTVVLPVTDPRVQAVLEGEPIVTGTGTRTSTPSSAATTHRVSGKIRDAQGWPLWAKVLLFLSPLLLPLIGGVVIFWPSGAKEPTVQPTTTATTEAASGFPVGSSGVAQASGGLPAAAAPTPTPIPPTASPTPTPTSTPFPLNNLHPAEDPLGVVSVEIMGTQIVLSAGEPDEQGLWNPQGPEWLAGTVVRPVIAIPADVLDVQSLQPGSPVFVRRRNGQVWAYTTTGVLKVARAQIEIMYQDRPGLVIVLVPPHPEEERSVILAAPKFDVQPTPTPSAANTPVHVFRGPLRLRAEPTLAARVLRVLYAGDTLYLVEAQPVFQDGLSWLHVSTSDGLEGWVASSFVTNP